MTALERTASPEADLTTAVNVQAVTHSFGDVSVLDGVSLSIPAGRATALVGANGSGKTTLLRILAGLVAPDGGSVRLQATSARPVGYLPQSPSFRSTFTVEETLSTYAALLPGEIDVHQALADVGLGGVGGRRVDALSGGMRRLLGIAQATLGEPDVVLLDEPTGDLDPRMTRHVFETIDALTEEGTAVVLATHNLAGAAAVDRVAILEGGSVATVGSPDALIDDSGGETLTDAFVHFAGDGAIGSSIETGADVGVAMTSSGGMER
jgi:ABC-type multidrug transport system ATPase subunit